MKIQEMDKQFQDMDTKDKKLRQGLMHYLENNQKQTVLYKFREVWINWSANPSNSTQKIKLPFTISSNSRLKYH